jgi:hypothetical protein
VTRVTGSLRAASYLRGGKEKERNMQTDNVELSAVRGTIIRIGGATVGAFLILVGLWTDARPAAVRNVCGAHGSKQPQAGRAIVPLFSPTRMVRGPRRSPGG